MVMPGPAVEVDDDAADLLHDRGLDALRRLVEQDHLGAADQHAADGELLLLAARHGAGALVGALLQDREELVDPVIGRCIGAPAHGLAHLQVLPHRHAREDVAALRHVADAEPGAAVGLELPRSIAAAEAGSRPTWCR